MWPPVFHAPRTESVTQAKTLLVSEQVTPQHNTTEHICYYGKNLSKSMTYYKIIYCGEICRVRKWYFYEHRLHSPLKGFVWYVNFLWWANLDWRSKRPIHSLPKNHQSANKLAKIIFEFKKNQRKTNCCSYRPPKFPMLNLTLLNVTQVFLVKFKWYFYFFRL